MNRVDLDVPMIRDKFTPEKITGQGVFSRTLKAFIRSDRTGTLKLGFDTNIFEFSAGRADIQIYTGGSLMEDTVALLTETNDQMVAAKKELADTVNQIKRMVDIVMPTLAKQIQDLRAIRSAINTESTATLVALKDVRKFFIERDYEIEMERVERFLRACDELKKLKADGTLDAVSDTIIRLSIQEQKG